MTVMLALFGSLLIFILMGIPIAISIGLAGLIGLLMISGSGVPLVLVPSQMFAGLDSFALMAIPFFILAGEMMNQAGLTTRIIELADSVVGHIKGGLAHVNVLGSMMMAGVSGSGAADTAAIGTVMIPSMRKKGYGADFSVVLTATASTVGPIIPPSVLFVIYGFLTNTSIGALFLGGAIPGIIMALGLMVTAHFVTKVRDYEQVQKAFSIRRVAVASKHGIVAIIVPFIIVGSIITGVATATEAGVVAVFIALFLGIFVFKTLRSYGKVHAVVEKSVHTTAIIFLILATSAIFSNVLTRVGFQSLVLETLNTLASTPTQMLIAIVGFILILGLFVDVTPILVMFAAPMSAVAAQIGYDPIFFGVVMVISAMIGSVTPPVGGLLLISCGIANIPLTATFKILIPFVLTLVVTLLLIIVFPNVVTFLPSLLMS